MNVLFCFLALFAFSCQTGDELPAEIRNDGTTAFSGNAMTMDYKILIGQILSQKQIIESQAIIKKTFRDTDAIFNKWNPNSELSRLNSQKSGISTPLSLELWRLFKETDDIVKLSQGMFDPTIEPIQALWKQKLQQGKIPEKEEIQKLAPAIGWDKVSFHDGIFIKRHDLTQLDFGGIAKGLCIDMLIERLEEAGFFNLYVEWGGEIRAKGTHPEERPWTVCISHLGDTNPDRAIDKIYLKNLAIATSGDYLQNWTINREPEPDIARQKITGKDVSEKTVTFFHIFDPVTLMPLETMHHSIASASVTASNCAFADGLATVMMMFQSVDEATLWMANVKEQYSEISFWIVTH